MPDIQILSASTQSRNLSISNSVHPKRIAIHGVSPVRANQSQGGLEPASTNLQRRLLPDSSLYMHVHSALEPRDIGGQAVDTGIVMAELREASGGGLIFAKPGEGENNEEAPNPCDHAQRFAESLIFLLDHEDHATRDWATAELKELLKKCPEIVEPLLRAEAGGKLPEAAARSNEILHVILDGPRWTKSLRQLLVSMMHVIRIDRTGTSIEEIDLDKVIENCVDLKSLLTKLQGRLQCDVDYALEKITKVCELKAYDRKAAHSEANRARPSLERILECIR